MVRVRRGAKTKFSSGNAAVADRSRYRIRDVPVARIRPEEGLGRKRDREGHKELQRSIQQFGVLTPITVRPAPDDSGEYLLINGQGRTLACSLLGRKTIPAIVVDDAHAEAEKVQQFLVENVARLKMRPIDRARLRSSKHWAGTGSPILVLSSKPLDFDSSAGCAQSFPAPPEAR